MPSAQQVACRCGEVKLNVTDTPIACVDCCCNSCRAAGLRLQRLPGLLPPAINLDLTGADATVQVGLVGYLRGDVDGSFAGASGALDLDDAQPGYFTDLVAEQPALNLAQFGIYGST